jgi:alcohol dehydrogenase (quinone), cytochrome c subunit
VPGATLFLGNCVSWHGTDRKGRAPYIPPRAGNPVVLDGNPPSLMNLVLNGGTAPSRSS